MKKKESVYIIAEAGVNHNGSLDMAKQLIDAAVEAGADAVKFQTFKAEKLVSRDAPKADYQKVRTNADESQYEMIKKLELDKAAYHELVEYSKKCCIQFLSSPFDLESVDFLMSEFDLPRLKLSSGEINNAPLLLRAATSGKPVILSTGMSTLGEVEAALGVLAFGYVGKGAPSVAAFREAYLSEAGQEALQFKVTLLHCTTEYPAPFSEVNLRAMDTLWYAFGLPVGFSDHTEGIAIPIAAVARGAQIIEKHFTLDRNLPGPDHSASLEPEELKTMVISIRQVEESLGVSRKAPSKVELKNVFVARKSLVASQTIKKGESFTDQNIAAKRPGTGISPLYFWDVLGRVADRHYEKDEVIEW